MVWSLDGQPVGNFLLKRKMSSASSLSKSSILLVAQEREFISLKEDSLSQQVFKHEITIYYNNQWQNRVRWRKLENILLRHFKGFIRYFSKLLRQPALKFRSVLSVLTLFFKDKCSFSSLNFYSTFGEGKIHKFFYRKTPREAITFETLV
jgi:hypothetical protein